MTLVIDQKLRNARRVRNRNRNERGGTDGRRRRKRWLLETYGDGVSVLCYNCSTILVFTTLTVDRIIPGCLGGTYRRDNIRPACRPCNCDLGGILDCG